MMSFKVGLISLLALIRLSAAIPLPESSNQYLAASGIELTTAKELPGEEQSNQSDQSPRWIKLESDIGESSGSQYAESSSPATSSTTTTTTTIPEYSDEQQQGPELCAICRLALSRPGALNIVVRCEHTFHLLCLQLWEQSQYDLGHTDPVCPICENCIPPVEPNGAVARLDQVNGDLVDEFEMCPICHDNLRSKPEIVATECNHLFHLDCFKIWERCVHLMPNNSSQSPLYSRQVKCPMCRRELT